MSYDLYFYRKAGESPAKKGLFGALLGSGARKSSMLDENGLRSFLTSYGHFSSIDKTDKGFEATYFNSDTGASAFFSFDRGETDQRCDYPGFTYTGLSLNINYFRPFFYGYEAALATEAICKKFDLYTADPQSSDEAPKMRTVDEVFTAWDASNTKSVRGQIERLRKEGKENQEISPDIWARMSRPMSEAWWSYRYHHDQILKYVDDNNIDAFVPTFIFVFKRIRDNRLVTCIPIADGVGYVLPRCDHFGMDSGDGKVIVESEALLGEIGNVLKSLPVPGMDLIYFTHEDAKSIGSTLRGLKAEKEEENYRMVPIYQNSAFVPGPFIDID